MLPKGMFFNSSMSTFQCLPSFVSLFPPSLASTRYSVTIEEIISLESMSFELFRTYVANGRMETLPIIEDLNVIEHISARLSPGLIVPTMNSFPFE